VVAVLKRVPKLIAAALASEMTAQGESEYYVNAR